MRPVSSRPANRIALLLLASLLGAATLLPAQEEPLAAGSEGVPVPKKVKHVQPVYPAEALAQGIRGIVILDIVVDARGKVASTSVLRSVPGLDEAAIAAARQWEYEPTKVDGKPVSVRLTVPITFSLALPRLMRDTGVPELRQGVAPAYPAGASSGGTATAEITLEADGRVASANLLSGQAPWSEALLAALKTWRFAPPPEDAVLSFRVEAEFVKARGSEANTVQLRATGLSRSELIAETPSPSPAKAAPAVAPPSTSAPAPTAAPQAPTPSTPAAPAPAPAAPAPAAPAPAAPASKAPAPAAPSSAAGAPEPAPVAKTPPAVTKADVPERAPATTPGAAPAATPPAAPPGPASSGPTTPASPAAPGPAASTPATAAAPADAAGAAPAPSVDVITAAPPPPPPESGISAVRDITLEAGVPELARGRRPVPPPFARMSSTTGTVEVTFSVSAGGVTALQAATGPELLRYAAEQTVASWVFRRTRADRAYLVAVFTFGNDKASAVVRPQAAPPPAAPAAAAPPPPSPTP